MKVITKQLKPTSAMKVICFSARVGSISDNKLGGWHSYRMSKAMLNMLVKNIALEWEYVSPTSSIVAYHPGTVETGLSKPFSKHIKHTIFNPTEAARHCLTVRDALTTERSGLLIDWQDKVVDY
jgi:NAD(P)-dependent dehydrogenase (short-subunit alcohol dehydrogenase family)